MSTTDLVCIVDDDKFLLDMYAMKFSERGFQVETAFSAKEMLEKLEGGLKPTACLLDVVMPEMDGFSLLEQIKQRHLCEDAVIIILSNLGQKEDLDRGLGLGADGYIVKANATPTEVVDQVTEILKNKKHA